VTPTLAPSLSAPAGRPLARRSPGGSDGLFRVPSRHAGGSLLQEEIRMTERDLVESIEARSSLP